ncbi:MAG TPA: rod-binding protein [Acidobacteriaceae bacterium]
MVDGAGSSAGLGRGVQADEQLAKAGPGVVRGVARPTADAKIEKSAHDFESILLGSWLEQAEQSFATVPGGDGEDEDTGKGQFQGIAMQALAGSLTRSGGIGIAKMIAQHLHASAEREAQAARSAEAKRVP